MSVNTNFSDSDSSQDSVESIEYNTFTIVQSIRKDYKRFNAAGLQLVVKLTEPGDSNAVEHFNKSIADVIDYALRDAEDSDMAGVTIFNDSNNMDKPIGLSFRRKDQISLEVIGSVIAKVCQSNARFCATDTLRVVVDLVKLPSGNGGPIKSKARSSDRLAYLKRSIVYIRSTINCLAYALVIAVAKASEDPDYRKYREQNMQGRKVRAKVEELLRNSGVDLSRGGGLPELEAFQKYYYIDYRIVVFSGLKLDSVIFDGCNGNKTRLNLLYDTEKKHYHTIINLTAAMAVEYICKGCNHGFWRGESHTCESICHQCKSVPPCDTNTFRLYCEICNRYFRGEKCFENHKTNRVNRGTVCEKVQHCTNCDKRKTSNHECFKVFCNMCKKNQEKGHLCYMAPLSNTVMATDKVMFVYYDLETSQDTKVSGNTFLHVPILLCAEQVCSLCEDSSENQCSRCGPRRHSFWNNPIAEFMQYLRTERPLFEKIIVIAHNARAFDLQFILDYAVKNGWIPKLIMNGSKILSLHFEHFVFLDSLNFIPLPLRAFPKTFGITHLAKGYFPHYFSSLDNLNYVGPYPNISFYGPDVMSVEDRKSFVEWYSTKEGELFDNKKELEKYCQADVTVLREACTVFKNLFHEIAKIHIFQEAITIAAACNKIYRKNFLDRDTIGLIPKGGYRMGDKVSKKSLMWLAFEAMTRDIDIRHAGNGREVRLPELPELKVDGYCFETKEVFEFLGCFFHGCLCLSNRDVPMLGSSETLAERFESTMARIERIASYGYTVHAMWECDFDKTLAKNPGLHTHPWVQNAPLVLREAVYGGRTEAMRLYHKAEEGKEKILYADVMSLYPWVCKYCKFPVGHPTVYTEFECEDFDLMLKKEGVVKCSVLPPRNLYHPVLPYRCNNRLMFCLCSTCAETACQDACSHKDKDRVLTGTWVVDEVREAVSMGYKIVKMFEFYEYEVTEYDPKSKQGGLFVNYIDTFLKVKAESSGFPSWVESEDDKSKYIKSFLEHEGIELEEKNIVLNPGKRAISKLCLNSFWGKLIELESRPQTKVIKEPKELYEFLSTPGVEVRKLIFANDQVVWINWTQEETTPLLHTSVVHGAYVTTGARLKLYTYLNDLGTRALYCDTDSVVYTQREKQDPVPLGDNLGQMTNELIPYGKDSFISEFVSGGPKNYGYRVEIPSKNTSETVCKVRGITLNYSALKIVNFNTIKSMILKDNPSDTVTVRTEKKIKRRAVATVVSEPEEKTYRLWFRKRRRVPGGYDSLPFGNE